MKKYALVLAAGKGTRMETDLPKCAYPILRKPMIEYIYENLDGSTIDQQVVVIGHKGYLIKEILEDKVDYVVQEEQLGTAHAVLAAKEYFKDKDGIVFIIHGDKPITEAHLIDKIIRSHEEMGNDLTLVSMKVPYPKGYGRIIRDEYRQIIEIIEEDDLEEHQKAVDEVNTGIYVADIKKLFTALEKVQINKAKQEYLLTDIVSLMHKDFKINTILVRYPHETMTVQDLYGISLAEKYIRERVNKKHMLAGVSIINPETVTLGDTITIERGATILPNTTITGKTVIKKGAAIGPNTEIHNSIIEENTSVKHSLIYDSVIGKDSTVGPFAHLRGGAVIGEKNRVGNFVEVKNSKTGYNTKMAHLAYIGDSDVGSKVNFGAGSITVNYDGVFKHKTIIGDNVFIGCNVNLIAPINVGNNVFLAAGSTVTKDVPAGALAIARNRQINKEDYVSNLVYAESKIESDATKITEENDGQQ